MKLQFKRSLSLVILLLGVSLIIAQELSLSLEEARNMALSNNHSLKMAGKEAESAELQRKASKTRFLPALSFNGAYYTKGDDWRFQKGPERLPVYDFSDSDNPVQVADQYAVLKLDEKIGSKNTYLFNFSLAQPVFTGGKIKAQYDIATSLSEISTQKEVLSRQETILKLDEAYWRLVSVQKKLISAQAYLETLDNHLRNIEAYFEEGLVTENEVLKVTVKHNEAQLLVLKAENGVSLSGMALNQILGIPVTTHLSLTDETIDSMMNVINPVDIEDVYNSRPEIEMVQQGIDISKSYKSITRSRYMPNIALQASYQFTNPNPYNSFKNEFGNDWTLALVAQLELFHWNERGYLNAAARKSYESSVLKLEETRELISLDVSQAEYKLTEARKREALTKSSFIQAERNLDITNNKFSEGLVKNTDVLEAQTLWYNAWSEWIDAQNEYNTQTTQYLKAIGKL